MHSQHANTYRTTICPARQQRNTLYYMLWPFMYSHSKPLNTQLPHLVASKFLSQTFSIYLSVVALLLGGM